MSSKGPESAREVAKQKVKRTRGDRIKWSQEESCKQSHHGRIGRIVSAKGVRVLRAVAILAIV